MAENEQEVADAAAKEATEKAEAEAKAKAEAETVEFTPAQQTKVNQLINTTFAKAWDKASGKITELETKLTTLQAALPPKVDPPKVDPPPKDKKDEKKDEKDAFNAGLQAQLEELKLIAKQLRDEKDTAEKKTAEIAKQNNATQIKEAFIRAADKFDFFDRMSEFTNIKEQLELNEDGQIVVLNPSTKLPRLNTNVQPMSLEEFVKDYATQKPWTVKSKPGEVAGGSGAGDSRRLALDDKTKVKDYSKMSHAELLAEADQVIAKQYQR